jgi:hypothetical protein
MKALVRSLADLCLAGFLFLLPVFVVFQIVNRGWTALGSVAVHIVRVIGARHILGVQAETAVTGVLLILMCVLFGWLVRFSLVSAFHNVIERQLVKYVPGYEAYKATTEGKVRKPVKALPYRSALVAHAGFLRPAYVIEQDAAGNSVVFLPDIPNTDRGHVLLTTAPQIQMLPSLSANQLDAVLKKLGSGLLSEHKVMQGGPADV